ncbi:preprotein translocase subunit SecG [bacterium]|nr:preprotein translocase subunit SecG [bacterium]
MLFTTVLIIHSLLCVVLIGLVLLQQGKGADAGATFGGSSSSLFGAAGATDFVTKLTTTLAIGFMVTSILLIRSYNSGGARGISSSSAPKSVVEGSIMQPVSEVGATTANAPETVESNVTTDSTATKQESASSAEGEQQEAVEVQGVEEKTAE